MKLSIDKSSSVPAQRQLRDQIKFAIGIGRLRPGDGLPSVRDLEQQLGLSKNTIWRVYRDLEEAHLLDLRQGKGACVNSNLPQSSTTKKLERAERMSAVTLKQVQRAGIHPASFARYFQQFVTNVMDEAPPILFAECNRTETDVFAGQISDLWGVDVTGVLIDDLKALLRERSRAKTSVKILTNIYHVEEVKEVTKGTRADVIGLHFRWDRRMVKFIQGLREPGKVLFLFAVKDERRYGTVVLDEFRSIAGGKRVAVDTQGVTNVEALSKNRQLKNYDLVFISNRLWHDIPVDVRRAPSVARPTLEIDPAALERARYLVGVI